GRGELPDVPHQEDDRILLQGRGLRRQRRRHRLRHPPALQRRGQRGQHFLRHLPVDQALRLVVGLDAEVPLLPHHRDDRCGGALGPQAPALLNCRAGHRGQAVSGRRLGLIAALALVVLANAVVLTGVARNRSGTDARVELTERECPLVKSLKDDDDSGMALELTAHWPNGLSEDGSPGIDRETLRALGFDVSMPLNSPRADGFYRRALPRDAFVVLEMEGPAWRRWLVEQQQHADLAATQSQALDLDWERRMGTRLFYVAAGRDPEALRQRYPDRAHYLILPA